MIKRIKALLISGAIVVLGVGAYVGYQGNEKAQTTVKTQEYIQQVCNIKDINRIEYQANDEIVLVKQAGKWTNEQDTHLQYRQEDVENWLKTVQTLQTKAIVKNVQDVSIYGMNDEALKVTLYDASNNKCELVFGDIIESEDSIYVQLPIENQLYVVSYEMAKALLVKPNDFVDCSEVIKVPNLQDIQIDYKDKTTHMMLEKEQWYLDTYFATVNKLNQDQLVELLETINTLEVVKYIGIYDDLEAYGLDSPRLNLTLNQTLQIHFGSQSGDWVYVSINKGKEIYALNKEVYNILSRFKPFEAMDKQVIQLDNTQIDAITLENPQGSYVLQLNQEAVKNSLLDVESHEHQETSKKENQETVSEKQEDQVALEESLTVALLNDIGLNQEEAMNWLDKIKESLYIEALLQNPSIEQKEERKAEATMLYQLKDGTEILIELIPYDINYYILRYNNVVEFAVSKEKVTKLFNELTQFTGK